MILVTGATGSIGRHVVRQLRAEGHPVRAFVRSAAKGEELGGDFAVGDFAAPETVRTALAGVDALFLNSTPVAGFDVQQTMVIALARAAGVARIVRISSAGARPDSPIAFSRVHAAVDARLAASGDSWFALRPGAFMKNLLGAAETVRHEGRIYGAYGAGRTAFIDESDIAACAVALLTGPARPSASFVIAGSEAFSYAEIAAKLSALLGKPVQYVDLPVERVVAQMRARGISPAFAEDLGAVMTAIAQGHAGRPAESATEALLGRPPRTLDSFLAAHVAAFR